MRLSPIIALKLRNIILVGAIGYLVFPSSASAFHPHQQTDPIIIGVLDLDSNNVNPGETAAISDRLRLYLGEQSIFQVIERQKMNQMMDEVGFQFSGVCDTDECVVQVGKILGARKMVAGSVSRVGTLYSLQIRLVDITSSSIEHQAYVDVDSGIEDVLRTATRSVAMELTNKVLDRSDPNLSRSGQAWLTLESNLQGAKLWFNGVRRSEDIPADRIPLTPGAYTISVKAAGYHTWQQTVALYNGTEERIGIVLEPKSPLKASALSLLIPGLGQYYSGRPFTGTIMVIGSGVMGYFVYQHFEEFQSLQKDYEMLQSSYDQALTFEDIQSLRNQVTSKHTDLRDTQKALRKFTLRLSGIWLLNVLDAIIRMPRLPRVQQGYLPAVDIRVSEGRFCVGIHIPLRK